MNREPYFDTLLSNTFGLLSFLSSIYYLLHSPVEACAMFKVVTNEWNKYWATLDNMMWLFQGFSEGCELCRAFPGPVMSSAALLSEHLITWQHSNTLLIMRSLIIKVSIVMNEFSLNMLNLFFTGSTSFHNKYYEKITQLKCLHTFTIYNLVN